MDRTFGVEIEVSRGPRSRGLRPADLAEMMAASGIPARYAGYTHAVTEHWKLVDDGSVTDGFELVSPILRGEAGLDQIRRLSPVLLAAGLTVNRSCGLHVHIGIADLTSRQVATIVKRYAAHEAKIDSFMAPSRQASNNTYCRSVAALAGSSVLDSPNLLTTLLATRRDGSGQFNRYLKVNLCSYSSYRTVEFRQHQGTIEAEKIVNWVKFLMGFIAESVRRGSPAANRPRRLPETLPAPAPGLPALDVAAIKRQARCKANTKTEKLLDKLMSGYSTAAELAEHAGLLNESSVAVILLGFKRRGIVIQTERPRGSKKKYRIALNSALRPEASAVAIQPVTTYVEPEPDKLFAGIDREVFKYYKGRAAQFFQSAAFEGAN